MKTKDPISELKKIVQMPDQKHWNCTDMREKALDEWISNWIIKLEYEQSVVNQKYLSCEFEDFLKEYIGSKLTEQAMESSVEIVSEKNRIKGTLICLRRKSKS